MSLGFLSKGGFKFRPFLGNLEWGPLSAWVSSSVKQGWQKHLLGFIYAEASRHFILQSFEQRVWCTPCMHAMHAKHAKSLQLCPTLCDPMDCSLPGSSEHGILQVRILEWVAMPSSRGSSQPRGQILLSYVSCIGRQVLYHWNHLRSPLHTKISVNKDYYFKSLS